MVRSTPLHARLILLAAALLVAAGCATGGPKSAPPKKLTVDDLDQLTLVFADRHTTLIATACDRVARETPDPRQRILAERFKLISCSSVYDIATSPDAFSRLLDLTLVVTLESQVWIDDGRAYVAFGDRAQPLVQALRQARRDVWDLAAQALTTDQLEGFDRVILRWRREHPDVEFVSYVRFNDVATQRAKDLAAAVRHGGGLLAPIDEAKQSVEAARKLGERAFFFGKRVPILVQWQVNLLLDQATQQPEVVRLTDDLHRLPEHFAAERKATLDDLERRAPVLNDVLARTRATIDDARGLVGSVHDTVDAVHDTANTADRIVQHVNETSNSLRDTLAQADVVATRFRSTTQPGRPVDVAEYDRLAKNLSVAAHNLDELVQSANRLIASPELTQRLAEANTAAEARIRQATLGGKSIVGFTIVQVIVLFAIFFLCLLAYSIIFAWIRHHFLPPPKVAIARPEDTKK